MNAEQVIELAGTLVPLLAGFGAFLRWCVNRIVKSNDDGTSALVANTASNAVLSVKVDNLVVSNATLVASNAELGKQLTARIDQQSTRLEGLVEQVERELTPVSGIEVPPRRTPPKGTAVGPYHIRPATKGGDK